MGRNLGLGVAELHDLRVAETAEAEPEVERRPGDEHEIGFFQRDRPCPRERELVIRRERAPAHAVHEHRHAGRFGERPHRCLRVRPVHVAAGDQHRSRRGTDERGDAPDRIGIRCVPTRRSGAGVDRRHLDCCGTEHIERDVDERGAAMRGARRDARGMNLLHDRRR